MTLTESGLTQEPKVSTELALLFLTKVLVEMLEHNAIFIWCRKTEINTHREVEIPLGLCDNNYYDLHKGQYEKNF